ncbi:MAG: sugar ABC transporter permease, partial [Verrucomicrobia bacterium]|nr:sugar ABC transporter permease [Verrucomicrobiota bacterium]
MNLPLSSEMSHAGTAGPWPKRHRRLTRTQREAVIAWLFILPDALGLAVFVGLPMLFSLGLGFFSVSGFGTYKFIGLANYARMFSDALFLKSLGVTVTYVLILVPGLYVAGLGLALLVKQKLPFVGLFRSMFFVPNVISLVVIGLVWQVLLIDKIGFVNRILQMVGLPGHSWLGDPEFALGAILVVTIWFLMGYYMILFLAGLQEIPQEYY